MNGFFFQFFEKVVKKGIQMGFYKIGVVEPLLIVSLYNKINMISYLYVKSFIMHLQCICWYALLYIYIGEQWET